MLDSVAVSRIAAGLSRPRASLLVIAVWLLVLPIAGYLGSMLYGVVDNDASSYLPRTAESTQVEAILSTGAAAKPADAAVVYVRDAGITPADRERVISDVAWFARVSGGRPLGQPIPSADGKALMLSVPVTGNVVDGVAEMRAHLSADRAAGLQASVTGPAGQIADFTGAWSGLDGKILAATVLVVTLVLLLTYRSPVLWLVPLLAVGASYNVAAAAVYLLARHTGMVISSETTGILPVLVFGAGTDYALLLIARYREELRRHPDQRVAMAAAWRRSVPAIAASAATVSIALLCLSAADMSSTRALGPAGAIGIASAFAGMTTLLPAVLVLAGRRVFWPAVPRVESRARQGDGVWGWIGSAVGRRPRLVWAGAALALALLATGLGRATFGLSQTQVFRTTPEFAVGQALLGRHYPAGAADPALIVTRPADVAAASAAAASVAGVAGVLPASQAGDRALVPVVLRDAPLTPGAEATVQRLRTAVHGHPGAMVGGDSAMDLDTRSTSVRDSLIVMPLVLAAITVVLTLLLRALVAALGLVATVVLSYLASLGAASVLFQSLAGFAGVDYSVPLMGFVFLVALGVDYNIFLMTRVREEVARHGHQRGVLRGLGSTGGVITSAGVVLAATFSVLGVMPIVFMVEIGTLVALGVLLDTFLVRSILVPALALDVGPATWWPSSPQRAAEGGVEESVAA